MREQLMQEPCIGHTVFWRRVGLLDRALVVRNGGTGRMLAAVLAIGLELIPAVGQAECACRCIDGQLKTVCTSVDEAAAQPRLCPRVPSSSCPQHPAGAPPASYPAPDEAATNCRNVALFDPVRGDYVTTRACDVP